MKFSITHDYMTAMYDIRLDISIDGLDVHVKHTFTEEVLTDTDNFLEWQAEHMMMEAMRIAAEASMPNAVKQMKEEIAYAKGGWSKPPAKPDGVSVKYGKTLTKVDDPGAFFWSPEDGYYVNNILSEHIDLDQKVPMPISALEAMGIEEIFWGNWQETRLEDAIINLNDRAKWSYDQIADWLETLDIDISLDLEGGE